MKFSNATDEVWTVSASTGFSLDPRHQPVDQDIRRERRHQKIVGPAPHDVDRRRHRTRADHQQRPPHQGPQPLHGIVSEVDSGDEGAEARTSQAHLGRTQAVGDLHFGIQKPGRERRRDLAGRGGVRLGNQNTQPRGPEGACRKRHR